MEALTVSQACEIAAISRTSFYRLLDDPDAGGARCAPGRAGSGARSCEPRPPPGSQRMWTRCPG